MQEKKYHLLPPPRFLIMQPTKNEITNIISENLNFRALVSISPLLSAAMVEILQETTFVSQNLPDD